MVQVLSRSPQPPLYEKCNGIYLHTRPITFADRTFRAAAYGWIDITLAMQDDPTPE